MFSLRSRRLIYKDLRGGVPASHGKPESLILFIVNSIYHICLLWALIGGILAVLWKPPVLGGSILATLPKPTWGGEHIGRALQSASIWGKHFGRVLESHHYFGEAVWMVSSCLLVVFSRGAGR